MKSKKVGTKKQMKTILIIMIFPTVWAVFKALCKTNGTQEEIVVSAIDITADKVKTALNKAKKSK